jgi:L-ascorbate metabolism protein UlaG (beta-lactamase superfamily)
MDWYEALTVPLPLRQAESLTLEMIPAHHWSRRSLWDTNKTLWAGFRLQTKDFHVVYTGDTGYSTIYKYMSRSWPPIDWLLVPVGCYEPRWFMRAQHVNPAEAQQITQDLGARQALGVHWGVFRLCDEPVEQPLIDLHEAQKQLPVGATRIQMWAIGESRTLLSR